MLASTVLKDDTAETVAARVRMLGVAMVPASRKVAFVLATVAAVGAPTLWQSVRGGWRVALRPEVK